MYGGANSHMAIRAAEFNLPAAIGVGDVDTEELGLDSMIWRGTSASDAVFLLKKAAVQSLFASVFMNASPADFSIQPISLPDEPVVASLAPQLH